MFYPKAQRLTDLGVKVFISNSGLAYQRYVTLLPVTGNLFIILDSDDEDNYPSGEIESYEEFELEEYTSKK